MLPSDPGALSLAVQPNAASVMAIAHNMRRVMEGSYNLSTVQVKAANLPDRSVRYLESGGGRAIVFLHAFPLSADQWLPQLHRLPPGWRGIAPDFRGFRGPGLAFPAFGLEMTTMESHGKDVLALLDHLDIARAVIAGSSMGGYVAFAMWRLAPERIAGLVLANTRATPDSADGLAARDRLIAVAEAEGPSAVAREMVPKLLGESTRREQPDLADVLRGLVACNATAGIVSAIRAMKLRPDSSPQLSQMTCPVQIIAGAEDTLMPKPDVEAMSLGIPGARSATVPRAGHLTNLEAPGVFNDILGGFLNGVSSR